MNTHNDFDFSNNMETSDVSDLFQDLENATKLDSDLDNTHVAEPSIPVNDKNNFQPDTIQPIKTANQSKRIVLIFIILAIVLALIILFVLIFAGQKGKQRQTDRDSFGGGFFSNNIDNEGKNIDYNKIIEDFVPDSNNEIELTVNEINKPPAAHWLENGNGSAYSSDESVVTVTDGGKVTAVGAGTAYIIISKSGMHEVYRYTVYNPVAEADLSNLPEVEGLDFLAEIKDFVPVIDVNTFELKIDETNSPTASVWAKNGGTCYSSDESVVTINTDGIVTAVGSGTAYILIKVDNDKTPQMPEGYEMPEMPEGYEMPEMPEGYEGSEQHEIYKYIVKG